MLLVGVRRAASIMVGRAHAQDRACRRNILALHRGLLCPSRSRRWRRCLPSWGKPGRNGHHGFSERSITSPLWNSARCSSNGGRRNRLARKRSKPRTRQIVGAGPPALAGACPIEKAGSIMERRPRRPWLVVVGRARDHVRVRIDEHDAGLLRTSFRRSWPDDLPRRIGAARDGADTSAALATARWIRREEARRLSAVAASCDPHTSRRSATPRRWHRA